MQTIEEISTHGEPNLDKVTGKILDNINSGGEFITERMPEIEACTERNQVAMNSFCKHEKVGLFSFNSTQHLLPKLEK